MFGMKGAPASRRNDEAEKPFWISYADLMTAMMVLFLVVMVASLASVTQRIREVEAGEKQRGQDITRICQRLEILARKKSNVIKVDCRDNRISFGEAGRFGHNQYFLDPQGQQALQDVVPLILDVTDSPEGQRWMKQVVVEGFTDTDGSYLYNLHLSLQRSEWVMCALLDGRSQLQQSLSAEHQQQIRSLFLAGGVSFNNAKDSKEASRRVELRMQFYGLKEDKQQAAESAPQFSGLMTAERCQLEMR